MHRFSLARAHTCVLSPYTALYHFLSQQPLDAMQHTCTLAKGMASGMSMMGEISIGYDISIAVKSAAGSKRQRPPLLNWPPSKVLTRLTPTSILPVVLLLEIDIKDQPSFDSSGCGTLS